MKSNQDPAKGIQCSRCVLSAEDRWPISGDPQSHIHVTQRSGAGLLKLSGRVSLTPKNKEGWVEFDGEIFAFPIEARYLLSMICPAKTRKELDEARNLCKIGCNRRSNREIEKVRLIAYFFSTRLWGCAILD